jgi:outer membrane protein TolC
VRLRFPVCVANRHFELRAASAALLAALTLGACHSPARIAVSPEASIAEAAQLATALEFRALGPEGGPLDEADAVAGALTLGEAVRRAVTTDPGLQAALARVRMAMAQADQARLLPNPVLDIVFRAGQGSPQFEASFVQEFVQALRRPTRAAAADNRLRAVAADAVVAALDVISEVQERYVDAQASAALLPLFEERLALLERLVSTSQARLDAGEGTRSDLVTLQAQHVELQVSIDRARLEEQTSRLRLARLIGEPSAAATWALDVWSVPALRRRTELEWTDRALAARPEIQAIGWRLAALGDDAELAGLSPWEAAQREQDRRKTGSEHRRIGDDHAVAFQALCVCFDKAGEVFAADLLFALRQHDHVHRQLPGGGEVRLQCLHVQIKLALVVN